MFLCCTWNKKWKSNVSQNLYTTLYIATSTSTTMCTKLSSRRAKLWEPQHNYNCRQMSSFYIQLLYRELYRPATRCLLNIINMNHSTIILISATRDHICRSAINGVQCWLNIISKNNSTIILMQATRDHNRGSIVSGVFKWGRGMATDHAPLLLTFCTLMLAETPKFTYQFPKSFSFWVTSSPRLPLSLFKF